jgi:diadenosine tetraphosphate (Ap4A) HIT family hydrolase
MMSLGPFEEGCRFCELPDRDRVLRIDDNFSIVLSLGPLVQGHFMLVARSHFQSSAELPAKITPTAGRVIKRLSDSALHEFGELTIFEHGRAGACVPPGHGQDHCYHAHVHFVPTNVALTERVQKDFALTRFDNWDAFQREHAQNPLPYLAIWGGDNVYVAFDPAPLPHHYLRSKVAEALGEPLFGDWAAFPRDDVIEAAKNDSALAFLRDMDMS